MKRVHLVFILILLSLVLYVSTWSPRATWEHFGEDGPELEAAGRVLGVPHPTGYPLLMLLVRLISLVVPPPISALNVITLLAAVVAVGSVGMAGRALGEKAWGGGSGTAWVAGLAAGAFFATSLTWWKQAVIGEVYTVHLALVASALALLLRGGSRRRLLAAYLLGLGLAHHLETVPFLLVVGVYLWLTGHRRLRILPTVFLLVPLSLYLVLVIRSRLQPPLDWGNPETLHGLWWVVSGAPYHGRLLEGGWRLFGQRLVSAATMGMVCQIGWGGTLLAGLGLVGMAKKTGHEAVALLLLFGGTLVVAAAYSIPDPAAYYLPAILALSLASGMGAAVLARGAMRLGRDKAWGMLPGAATAGILVALVAARVSVVAPQANARGEDDGYRYARDALSVLKPGSLVLSHGDGRTFSLWYATTVLESRPDVIVIYDNLLGWDWYRRLLRRTHPGLALPARGLPRPILRGAILERYRAERPVFVTELEPELEPLFRVTPEGPLFRVEEGPRPNAIAAASSDRKSKDGRPLPPG